MPIAPQLFEKLQLDLLDEGSHLRMGHKNTQVLLPYKASTRQCDIEAVTWMPLLYEDLQLLELLDESCLPKNLPCEIPIIIWVLPWVAVGSSRLHLGLDTTSVV